MVDKIKQLFFNKGYEDSSVKDLIHSSYQYGFKTDIVTEAFPRGITEDIVMLISGKKKEPSFVLSFRLRAYSVWVRMAYPEWACLSYAPIDYNNILCYSMPKFDKKLSSLSEVDGKILKTFEKLGVPLGEQKRLANVAVDAIFDSVSVGTTFREELLKVGVIFCPLSEAFIHYPHVVERYFGSVVPIGDNYFSALNSAVFSEGSFCYVPKGVCCPLDLSTYFRINAENSGQFERTLIVADDSSKVTYLEGCTAPKFDTNQLHAAVVELVALRNAEIRYSTVQNWYSGDAGGLGGIYNFVTKRGVCSGFGSRISWTQVETGSSLTWKYPSCLLVGDESVGEFYSVALTNNYQQADTGTKMVHVGKKTRSRIVSKGISVGNSKNTYRGQVRILPKALGSSNYSQCDSLLVGSKSQANTFPHVKVGNSHSRVEHEASTSKVEEEQLFYLSQRGIGLEEAINLLVSGFCREVFNKLPMEFAVEADRLLSLKLEGGVG
ncbi:putative ABC transporter (plastid) [Cryptomonas paramecium]|uniref:Putative ABC transporter n=1 Tax=Cryptomonas paramaecium TaxID=2898 RepID=D2IS69_9CRYP|nr:putative ABC transporter [Cryptomonas paramecium]ACT46761.1 putative ABC transporter [Cryptomonas paramecium]BDA98035.1 putative ABC transporter [Cryptomonas paramecium]